MPLKLLIPLGLCLCAVEGLVDSRQQDRRPDGGTQHGYLRTSLFIQGSLSDSSWLDPEVREKCKPMFLLMLGLVCCEPCTRLALGNKLGGACTFALNLALLVFFFHSGIFSAWYNGEKVGVYCQIISWWFCISFVLWTCTCCCFAFLIGTQNKVIRDMKQQYEDHKKKLSGPRRDYFESDTFREKCNKLFEECDTDNSGFLEMAELQECVFREFGPEVVGITPLFALAFDENRDSRVEKAEFTHMMQYFKMLKFKEGQFTEESAWEVLQLDPNTASYDDVKRSYKKLALRFHPDKRKGVSDEEVKRDMAEINDAKALLDKKFQGGSTPTST